MVKEIACIKRRRNAYNQGRPPVPPVRAHLVQSPEEYPWSSHRAYLGMEEIPWLTTDWVLSLFALDRKNARAAYTDFMALER